MKLIVRKYFLSFFLWMISALMVAAIPVREDTLFPAPLKIDKQTEQDIFSDKDYSYVTETEKGSGWFDDFIKWLIQKIFGNLSPESMQSFWTIVTIILAVLFVGALVFVIIKMKGGRLFKGESARTSIFADIHEDIDAIDIDDLIRKAKSNEDYRLAFRYSFLKSLQLMNNKKLIDWKPYKTNYDYYNEFALEKIKPVFKDLYRGFEYVWYGDAAINKDTYEKYSIEFNEFNGQLGV